MLIIKRTDICHVSIRVVAGLGKFKRIPCPNFQEIEEIKRRLKEKTGETEFFDVEILNEFEQMQENQ